MTVARTAQDGWALAITLNTCGDLARAQGDYSLAAQLYEQSIAIHQGLGSQPGTTRASALHNLGYVATHQGYLSRAVELFTQSLRLYQRRGERRGVTECVAGLACVLAVAGQSQQAARLFGAAEAALSLLDAQLSPSNRADYERGVARARSGISPNVFSSAWMSGGGLSLEDAVREALATTAVLSTHDY